MVQGYDVLPEAVAKDGPLKGTRTEKVVDSYAAPCVASHACVQETKSDRHHDVCVLKHGILRTFGRSCFVLIFCC